MSVATHELLPACQVLFGATVGRGAEFLETLHEDLVKQVFRKRAAETHPDRASSAGLDAGVMTLRFQEVNAANELLRRYLAQRASAPIVVAPRTGTSPRQAAARPAPRPAARPSPRPSPPPKRPPPKPAEHFWSGRLPDRALPLGEFLFYSGHISLQALIAAIHSQRVQRPVFGQLAMQRGFLRASTIATVLSNKRPGERLGEAALRLGVLTPYQRDVVLGLQMGRQHPFGRYFTDTGALSEVALREFVRAQHLHNFRSAARRAS